MNRFKTPMSDLAQSHGKRDTGKQIIIMPCGKCYDERHRRGTIICPSELERRHLLPAMAEQDSGKVRERPILNIKGCEGHPRQWRQQILRQEGMSSKNFKTDKGQCTRFLGMRGREERRGSAGLYSCSAVCATGGEKSP